MRDVGLDLGLYLSSKVVEVWAQTIFFLSQGPLGSTVRHGSAKETMWSLDVCSMSDLEVEGRGAV